VDAVGRFFERVLASRPDLSDSAAIADAVGAVYPDRARQLGQRTAELHRAVAAAAEQPAFAPEPFSTLYQRSLYQATRGALRRTLRVLSQSKDILPPDAQQAAEVVIANEAPLLNRYAELLQRKVSAAKTMIHGSFHLGQVLNTGKDFVIIDLEGEPSKSLSERRLKRSPLVDVVSMIRSLDYAANSALRRQQPDDAQFLAPYARTWTSLITEQFLSSYLETMRGSELLPEDPEELRLLLEVFLMDRAVVEINNELASRPAMVGVPLNALRNLVPPPV
jgi:maltose alpha-D-glucosyltransferase/alpha-amylase